MGRRDALVSKSILLAIFDDRRDDKKKTLLARILAFFSLFQLALSRYKDELFKQLRTDVWQIDDAEYRESFRRNDRKARLKPIGDLGYSGSVSPNPTRFRESGALIGNLQTFFTTPNGKYLIKSVPRPSEYNFFKHDLLQSYAAHMKSHPDSLLVRITDFLHAPLASALGSLLGLAPSHHIIMENILYGKAQHPDSESWETYDLKPPSYFYPERDIAGGALAPDSVKERLLDTFPDKIRVTPRHRAALLATLEQDTQLLADANAVDYSLFLVRYPAARRSIAAQTVEAISATLPAPLARRSSPWRDGVPSADGKWIYRAVVLDFFWAKHRLQARAMTALVNTFNFLGGRKEPMSITTESGEYRGRFLGMVKGLLEGEGVEDGAGNGAQERE